MARVNLALILRLLLSLAMFVAAMPVKASEAGCAVAIVSAPKPVCRMACCEGNPKAATTALCDAAISRTVGHRHAVAKAVPDCGCELKVASRGPVAEVAVVPGFDSHTLLAVAPSFLPNIPTPLAFAEPGIFGVDSGPPPSPEHPGDSGRAPPVARA